MNPKVRQLYKDLLWLAKNYPGDYPKIRDKLHDGFIRNARVSSGEELEKCLEHGEFIAKELQSLYFLRTYRAVKRNYYD
ncbi:unnamed protein product [Kuraishia capsulata CBS 1993]|uniref:Mitochondrial zinc maintenance protein 1, mitochondrial n=1 Tax=Kuraishia capsulata CBS 1993 TaxID=1382522 RepID=W6MGF8_9ASCO|nr:uncharacterized protein KUCA_T00000549001 [Kuraishia capsulata CBS 1993]CDK24583.1 unnamed protein product [Kuraishia capsulata CBS 1993]